jgi:hypothetical protein
MAGVVATAGTFLRHPEARAKRASKDDRPGPSPFEARPAKDPGEHVRVTVIKCKFAATQLAARPLPMNARRSSGANGNKKRNSVIDQHHSVFYGKRGKKCRC